MAEYEALGRAIEKTVREACEGKKVGVAFSGGVDSGLVAALASKYAESVTCYTCGTRDAFDVRAGKELAEILGLPWVHCRIGKDNIDQIIREIIRATGVSDPFTISYELQLFCVCKTASEDIILTGQGSDEYLGGSAKFIGISFEDYEVLRDAGIQRLNEISVPCEMKIASYFGKELRHPYLTSDTVSEIQRIDPRVIMPESMETRKSVLKKTVEELGYPVLAHRTKKASQYGSGTTDLIRSVAKEKGKMYNQYIASVYDEVAGGIVSMGRGSVINARVDPVVKAKAERILLDNGLTPSEAVEQFYRRVISENGISFLRERARYAFYEQNAVTRIGHFQMPRAFRSLSATP